MTLVKWLAHQKHGAQKSGEMGVMDKRAYEKNDGAGMMKPWLCELSGTNDERLRRQRTDGYQ